MLHLLSRNTSYRLSKASTGTFCDIFARSSAVHCISLPSKSLIAGFASAPKKSAPRKKKKGINIKIRRAQTYPIDEALRLATAQATARFDETVELALQLGIDPRKSNENVRGVVNLPNGTGKSVRVAVFARGAAAEAARAAGADVVGTEDLVESIQGGQLNFDKVVATPDVMALVGRVARVLGPRGMMPNPKLGTVTTDVTTAVKNAKAGQVQFRNEKQGIIHVPLGKASWNIALLRENVRAMMLAITASKPDAIKGVFLRKATISTTQGCGIHVDLSTIDPGKARFMLGTDPLGPEVAVFGLDAGKGATAPGSDSLNDVPVENVASFELVREQDDVRT